MIRLGEVQPEIQAALIASKPEFFGEAVGTVHRSLFGAGEIRPRVEPFELRRFAVADARGDAPLGRAKKGGCSLGWGFPVRGEGNAAKEVDVFEMLAE